MSGDARIAERHGTLVQRLAEALREEGWEDVRADLTGAIRPVPVKLPGTGESRTPDVTARRAGRVVLFEVELAETVDSAHTADKWPIVARHATDCSGDFIVVVPSGNRSAAEMRLRELAVEGRVRELP